MIEEVKKTILSILSEKRAEGDVLPYVTSVEVARFLSLDVKRVEAVAFAIEGIEVVRTQSGECCYYE